MTNKAQQLLDIYSRVLKYFTMEATSDGFIFQLNGSKNKTPFCVSSKQVVLPLQAQLQNPDPDHKLYFHPLSENNQRSESEIIAQLTRRMIMVMGVKTMALGAELLGFLSNPEKQKEISPKQGEICFRVKEVNAKSIDAFLTLCSSYFKDRKSPVSLYLKRAGNWKGQKYARVGVLSFPMYEELVENKEDRITRLREKDRLAFISLLEYMFPSIQDSEEWMYGSDILTAPYFDALMNTSLKVAERINDIDRLFSNILEEPGANTFDVSWREDLKDIDSMLAMIRMIPTAAGNEGSQPERTNVKDRVDVSKVATDALMTPAPVSGPRQLTPEKTEKAAPKKSPTGKISVEEMFKGVDMDQLARNNAMYAMQSMMPPPPVYGAPGMYPQQFPGQQMMPPGYPMQQGFPGHPMMPGQMMPPQQFPGQPMMPPPPGFPGQQMQGQMMPPPGFPMQQGFPPPQFPGQQMMPPQGFPPQGFPPQGFPGQQFPGQMMPPPGFPGQQMQGQPQPMQPMMPPPPPGLEYNHRSPVLTPMGEMSLGDAQSRGLPFQFTQDSFRPSAKKGEWPKHNLL